MPHFGLDGQRTAECAQQLVRVDAGRDDDRVRVQAAERAGRLPAAAGGCHGVDLGQPDVDVSGDGLDRSLRVVEVAVVLAPGGSRELVHEQPGNELGGLCGETIRDAIPSAFCTATFAASCARAASLWATKR